MFGSSVHMSNSNVTVNGVSIKVPKNASVSVVNGKVFVNGKEYNGEELQNKQVVNLIIIGDVSNVNCNGSVNVYGNVNSSIDCGGSISVDGSVTGDIDCGGSSKVGGYHIGNIDAGGSVTTGR